MKIAAHRTEPSSPVAGRMVRVLQARAAFFQRRFGLALGELAALRLMARKVLRDVVVLDPDEHLADAEGEGAIIIGKSGMEALDEILVATGAKSPSWESGGDASAGALGQLLAVERRDAVEEVALRIKSSLAGMSCAPHNTKVILQIIDQAVDETAPLPPPPPGAFG